MFNITALRVTAPHLMRRWAAVRSSPRRRAFLRSYTRTSRACMCGRDRVSYPAMSLRTFSIQTLGCRVNQYEAEQMAGVLRRWGLVGVGSRDGADLRVVHTCSVTTEAAGKSRQSVRRATRLPVL